MDVVYDAVGGAYTEPALRSPRWRGRLLVVGFAAGEIPKIPLNLPLLKGCSIVGVKSWATSASASRRASRKRTEQLGRWYAEGKLRPAVSETCRSNVPRTRWRAWPRGEQGKDRVD